MRRDGHSAPGEGRFGLRSRLERKTFTTEVAEGTEAEERMCKNDSIWIERGRNEGGLGRQGSTFAFRPPLKHRQLNTSLG